MKKIATLLLLTLFTLSLCSFAHAESDPEGIALAKTIRGTIVSDADGLLEVASPEGASVMLKLAAEPYVVDCLSGNPASLQDRSNDTVVAYYGPVETRSMPPQSNPILIIVNVPDNGFPPHYAKAEAVEKDGEAVKVTVDNGSLIITINPDVSFVSYADAGSVSLDTVAVGDELLMWYPVVALSYPGLATAEKALLLNRAAVAEATEETEATTEETPDTTADTAADNFTISTQDTLTENGVIMVPLRLVAEAAGFEVTWDGDTRAVNLTKETVSCTITIDANIYSDGELENPPIIVNDRTFAPIYFFEEALGIYHSNADGIITFYTEQ